MTLESHQNQKKERKMREFTSNKKKPLKESFVSTTSTLKVYFSSTSRSDDMDIVWT